MVAAHHDHSMADVSETQAEERNRAARHLLADMTILRFDRYRWPIRSFSDDSARQRPFFVAQGSRRATCERRRQEM